MPDSEIDFSDIPELDEKFWRNAVRNPFYRPPTEGVSVRLDADVAAWLRKHGGKKYESLANRMLRRAMRADTKNA